MENNTEKFKEETTGEPQSKGLIKGMAHLNNEAYEYLSKLKVSELHQTCENFKNLAGAIVSRMQMVEPSTVKFLREFGADYSKLKDASIECSNFKQDLESVRDYLVEILSYLD